MFNRTTQVVIDLAVLNLAFWAAFALRFDGAIPAIWVQRALVMTPFVLALQYGALHLLAVPRFVWRFVGMREAQRIVAAFVASTVVLLALRVTDDLLGLRAVALPASVVLIDAVFACLGVVGIRLVRRAVAERVETKQLRRPTRSGCRTILIGAGQAGFLIAKEIAARPDLGIAPVGFLDDDPQKRGTLIHGLPVLGRIADLPQVKDAHQVEQALITIANTAGHVIRRIASECESAGLRPKIIPGIYEIVGGQVSLTRIRNVSIEDLLGRAPVELEAEAIASGMRGRTVLVTGAGGSIGAELCRQLGRFAPRRLVLVERAENALFVIDRELRARFPDMTIEARLADVGDLRRMERLFAELRPDAVYHAAAHKHVPLMEENPGEAIKNNVCGTRTLADLAHEQRVGVFVLVSTDKAVRPTSIMGATKRVAELYVQALAERSATRFVTVRFGNVLGSNGSVVPIFQEQIARGGPVTVTHPDMTRFFMTIPEACQLILQAASMGEGGETFVLDMGAPVKIVDLARDLISLSGFRPDVDVAISFCGMRPGEKLHEQLSLAEEETDRTRHPKILIARSQARSWEEVGAAIERLEAVSEAGADAIGAELEALIPGFRRGPGSDAHRAAGARSTTL